MVLVADLPRPGRLELAFLGGLLAFALWALISAVWSPGAAAPVLEAERGLLYVAAAAAAIVLLSFREAFSGPPRRRRRRRLSRSRSTRSRRGSSRAGSAAPTTRRAATSSPSRSATGTRSGCSTAIGNPARRRVRGARRDSLRASLAAVSFVVLLADALLHLQPRRARGASSSAPPSRSPSTRAGRGCSPPVSCSAPRRRSVCSWRRATTRSPRPATRSRPPSARAGNSPRFSSSWRSSRQRPRWRCTSPSAACGFPSAPALSSSQGLRSPSVVAVARCSRRRGGPVDVVDRAADAFGETPPAGDGRPTEAFA